MLDYLNNNFLLICAFICLILILALSLYKPKGTKINNDEVKEPETSVFEDIKDEILSKPVLEKKEVKEEIILPDENIIENYPEKELDSSLYEEELVELVSFDTSSSKNNLDNLISKMQEDLNAPPKTRDEFLDEQEKTAIISYSALKKAMSEGTINTYQDEDEEYKLKEENKFKPSPHISPVEGLQNQQEEEFLETLVNFRKHLD